MTYLLSFDPGKVTGITLGHYSDTKAYERDAFWAVQGGLEGFLGWFGNHFSPDYDSYNLTDYFYPDEHGPEAREPITWAYADGQIVSERFVLRSQKFVADTTPILIEGAMAALGMEPIYQLRSDKALVPDQILKDQLLWVTGSMCGWTDGRDVNDSAIHALAYLKKQKHLPTLQKFFGE